jgi:hypothetical protein
MGKKLRKKPVVTNMSRATKEELLPKLPARYPGRGRDKALALQISRTLSATRFRRELLGKPPRNPKWRPWTRAGKALLGRWTDREVSARTAASDVLR